MVTRGAGSAPESGRAGIVRAGTWAARGLRTCARWLRRRLGGRRPQVVVTLLEAPRAAPADQALGAALDDLAATMKAQRDSRPALTSLSS